MVEAGLTRLKVGVVGAGRWGRNLIRCFSGLPEVDLVAVCDLTRPPEAVLGGAAFFATFDGLLASAGVSAVVIATPAEWHATQAVSALERGCHVFVEKPMALSLRDAIRVRDAARAAGRVLMVGHLLRYHPAILQLKRWVDLGHLGRIERIVALRLGPGTPDAASNPWWSLAPHDLSLVRYLLRGDITEMTARHGALGDAPLLVARARVGNATADVVVSAAHDTKVRRLVVFGSERTARFDDGPAAPSLWLHEGRLRPSDSVLHDVAAASGDLGTTWSAAPFMPVEPLAAEAAHFVAAALQGGRVATDAEEGCRVIAALEAGSLSLSQNGAWAKVPGAPLERRLWATEPEQLS